MPTSPPGTPIVYFTANAGTFQDTGFTTPTTAAGDPVKGWQDQSGNAHHASANNANCTLVTDTDLCDDIAVQFYSSVGAQAILQTGTFTWNQPEHMFILVKHLTGSDQPYLWDGRSNDSMTAYWSQLTNKIDIIAGAPFTHECQNSDFTALDTWGILEVLYNGASSFTRVNNNAKVTVSGTMGTTGAGGLTIGNYNSSSAGGRFRIAAIVGYNTALSDDDATAVRSWLSRVFLTCTDDCINFKAYFAREFSGSDESCNNYGTPTNLTICTRIAAGHYCLQADVVDLNGAMPGENVRLKISRFAGDTMNSSIDPCSVVKAAIEYDVD